MRYEIAFSCASHVGRVRSINQDNFICNGRYIESDGANIFSLEGSVAVHGPYLFGVFDGMGGEECGEIASYIAAKEAALTRFGNNGISDLLEYCKTVNQAICKHAEDYSISSMGTTAALLLFSKNGIDLCNIGDSRIFRYADDILEQISQDHVSISAFGTKPPLTQNLGIPPSQLVIEPYFSQGGYSIGDKYLICSDGLTDMLTNDEITAVLKQSEEQTACVFVEEALKNGGKDNVTVILLEVKQSKNRLSNIINRYTGGKKV